MSPNLRYVVALMMSLFVLAWGQGTSPQRTTVVEGNHFFSNYQINTTYNIAQVSVQRPIIFILRKKDQNQVFDNNITVNLISGDKSVQCKFASFNGMCYLQKLPSPNMTMKLKCDHLPCEASWTILQPSLKKVQSNQNIQQMYDISESADHMIAMISCNNPQIKNFDQLVQTYSENEYVRGYTQNIIYLLFKKQKSGHLFFKIDPKAKACAQMAVYNIKQQISPEQQYKDFVFSNESSVYSFGTRPVGQFRIDCAYHQMTKQPIKSQLKLKITGQKNGMRETIVQTSIQPPIASNNYQFSYAVAGIPQEYGSLQVEARSSNNILIFNYYLALGERIQIEQSEHTHFKLKKGSILKFKLISTPDADKQDQVFFYLNKPNLARLSLKQCSKKDGCEFQIQALSESDFILYAGKTSGGDSRGEVNFIDFKQKITKKVRDQQMIYLKTPIKKDEVIKVLVNNPNVIIRAASQQKCSVPNSQCYQHIANSHHHFIYQPKKDGFLLMSVLGLDSCEFTVTVIQEGSGSIQLKDGEPFLYLMDDRQNRIYFRFILPQKIGVSFNLIAPLNDLLLVVNNGKQKPNGQQHTASTDGYISFAKSELQSNQFRIMVQKTSEAKMKSVHFTLIASTSGSNLRLDPGIAHTESLKPKQYKDFVFEFDKKGDYIINFYTPNIDKQDINIRMMVNNEDSWTDSKVEHLSISENSDVLNLKDISENLCIKSGDLQCQIFLRIVNAMKIQIDITVTLLVKDSVIDLKDGLWQTYAINTIAKTSHFYFLPKTKNSSVSIMYKSSLIDIGISYTLWKSDKENIDPTQWPFPPYKEDVENKYSNYRSVNHIIIDTQTLKGCWPSCVILISLYKKKSNTPTFFDKLDPNIQGNFSIMAANKMFEIPQKSKMEIMLRQDEEKYLMVDLKYSLEKEALTFFVNSILGSFSLYGNVYSQKNPRCPTVEDHDFNFGQIQTQIKLSSVQSKRDENEMSQDQDIFLCILARPYLQSKFTIQFTSDQEIIKLLHFDSFQRFQLQPKQIKLFQLEAQQDYEIKFTREKGFFYVKITVCNDNKDYGECLDQLKSQKDKGKQIITKTQQFSQKPCPKCIVFIKVESDDYCQAVIHVQSKYSIVELKQNDIISDFTNQGEVNRYSITSVQKQETIINIEVTEGEPIVTVTNYGDLSIEKQKNPNTNHILIVIPPQKMPENTVTALGGINYDAFTYSYTFRYFHVEIKSKNPKLSTAYTISYSSGERQTYMEDGMAVGYTLQPNKKTTFLYKNPSQASHGYLSLTMDKSAALFNLKFKMFTFSDPNDQDTKTEVTPQKPPMRKHTPNPTIVYSIPAAALISIELESQNQQKVTLMINHQQLIILPFDQQFPFELHKNQTINIITDVNNPGYLLVTIRKCDQTSPDFGYTFDYESFQKSEFEYTTSLTDDPKFQFYIKASKIGTLYMQMNVTDEFGLFSIKIHYNDTKIKSQRIKAGKNGVLQYKIVDSNKAEIRLSAVVCSATAKCDKNVKYYYMTSNNLQDVYTQTVCPYSYFQVLGISSSQPIKINEITAKPDADGVIIFPYNYTDHVSYISVKAVSGDTQIYYQPMEVITLWGSMARASKANKVIIIIGFLFLCLFSLILIRRTTKPKDYEKLAEPKDSFDY